MEKCKRAIEYMQNKSLAPEGGLSFFKKKVGGRWWTNYWMTFVAATIPVLIAGYHAVVHLMNPIPALDELIEVPIKVLAVHESNPHLSVQVADSFVSHMEFPAAISIFNRRQYYGLSDEEWGKLPGCTGVARGVPIRFVLGERFRVWALHCGDVHFELEQSSRAFERAMPWEKIAYWIYCAVNLFFTLIVYMSERRKLRELKK